MFSSTYQLFKGKNKTKKKCVYTVEDGVSGFKMIFESTIFNPSKKVK